MLLDLNLGKLHYYPFMVSLDRCDGSCNTIQNHLVGCLPNKTENELKCIQYDNRSK